MILSGWTSVGCKAIQQKTGAYIQDVDYENFIVSATELCHIYNSAFDKHFGFVPFAVAEFIFLARSLQSILIKQLLFKVMIGNKAVGFILAIPNLNEIIKTFRDGKLNLFRLLKLVYNVPKIKDVKIMIAAIAKPYQHLGLGSLLYVEMDKRTKALGITNKEISWVAAENVMMNKVANKLGAEISKAYAIYEFDM
jgi:GNAT superfamily N-acetyltransferase